MDHFGDFGQGADAPASLAALVALDPSTEWRVHEFAESPRPGQKSWALLRGEGVIP